MGQTNSRHHEPSAEPESPTSTSSSTTIPVAGASTDSHLNPSADTAVSTPDGPGSRRSSLRKSILKYVKPSSVRNRLGGAISHQPKEAGRRSSKHCSQTPHDSSTLPPDTTLDSTSNGSIDNATDVSPSDKGKQREAGPSDDREDFPTDSVADADQSSPIPNAISQPEHNTTDITLVSAGSHTGDDTPPDPFTVGDGPCPVSRSPDESESISPQDYSAEHSPESNGNASEPESQFPSDPRPSEDPQARPFPPPGTLVVVQGIVHTTDVSRNGGSTSTPQPPPENTISTASNSLTQSGAELPEQSRSRARNRLSALLRPRAASSRPRPASMNDSLPVVAEAGVPVAESATVSPSASQASQIGSSYVTPDIHEPLDASNSEAAGDGNLASATENRPPSISSSSIDVLGTLLSVAAAATAASLLTGSSEPILSSGLAPPGSTPPIPSVSPLSSPAIPTALPNLPPYPSPPPHNTGIPDLSAAGRAERLRQAWSTIRERLGLRPSAPSLGTENMNSPASDTDDNGSTSSPPNNDHTASGTPTDTRELMLAEMARAFNIGLGLNGLSNLTPNAVTHTSDDREAPSAPQDDSVEDISPSNESEGGIGVREQASNDNPTVAMPPEGSFERFLVDLQIDLRAALTQNDDEIDHEQNRPRGTRGIASPPPSTSNATRISDSDNSSSATVLPSFIPERPTGNIEVPVAADHDPFAEMPPLQEVSDSDSESEEDDQLEFGDDDETRFANHGFPEAADPSTTPEVPNQTHPLGSGHIDASGRINWWRLYRFPAVPSPRNGSRQPTSVPASPLGPFSFSNPPPTEAISADQSLTNASPSDSTSSSLPPSQPSSPSEGQTSTGDTSQTPLTSVVPVIVVGLQSVNQAWQHDIPPQPTTEDLELVGHPATEDPISGVANEGVDPDELDGLSALPEGLNARQPSGDGLRTPRRARNWHSRAATAIRNLRSGRRNAEAGTGIHVPSVAPGSRTFFIYVIGGYYPPDHSIVTGGPNILDSFEALLELADLLGQVKPPTVSKEDIEKSGLKIVKASELEQLEKQGQVASNCLDRCLICLDDYDAEDPIRLMSCRHAFHKGCVDEWLQKGRNNCPACRSTGVSTDSHSASSMPTPTS